MGLNYDYHFLKKKLYFKNLNVLKKKFYYKYKKKNYYNMKKKFIYTKLLWLNSYSYLNTLFNRLYFLLINIINYFIN